MHNKYLIIFKIDSPFSKCFLFFNSQVRFSFQLKRNNFLNSFLFGYPFLSNFKPLHRKVVVSFYFENDVLIQFAHKTKK